MEMHVVSDMAKVLPLGALSYPDRRAFEALGGEAIAFQVMFRETEARTRTMRVDIDCDAPYYVYQVRYVPVERPVGNRFDEYYLSTQPGMYPDCLEPFTPGETVRTCAAWQSLFFVLEPFAAGEYPMTIRMVDCADGRMQEACVRLSWQAVALPAQTLKYTRWVHYDALAEHYGVEMFSDAHFEIVKAFLRAAVRQGMNMALTPIHTPPLDTEIGKERMMAQLVRITRENGRYVFNFDLLDRFIALCTDVGIRYFEMAHLYTQWGANAAPKIVATVDGVQRRIFGWDTPACSAEYADFLSQYLTALTAHLRALGIAERCYFHISDEPYENDKAQYLAARRQAEKYLTGFPIMDALSHVALFNEGIVRLPVPASTAVEDFLDLELPERWTYYCCSQMQDVSNSFIAMPGERTRVLGIQLYRHQMDGFLHWGLNYYYNERSHRRINPFLTTDGERSYPAGDPFNLYPAADGTPMEALRAVLMRKALEDMRALQLLEEMTSRAFVCDLIDETAGFPVTFRRYPHDEEFIINLRGRVNAEIAARTGKAR